MIDSAAHVIARFGAIVLLLATAAACGFIVGRATAPARPPSCSNAYPATATMVGGKIIVTQVC